jgi:hypothetical protein
MPKEKTIPVFPNKFPWNELLFRGDLTAKTRNWYWKHVGWTLLYTSKSRMVYQAYSSYKLDPEKFKQTFGTIVGIGYLLPVRENTEEEKEILEYQFVNGRNWIDKVEAGIFRYEFDPVYRFVKPIPFTFPKGAVRTTYAPISLVELQIKRFEISI